MIDASPSPAVRSAPSDDESIRLRRFFRIISLGLILSGIIPLLHNSWFHRWPVVCVLAIAEALVALAWWLNHRGLERLSAHLLLFDLLAMATSLLCFSNDGFRGVAPLLFPGILVIAGLLFNRRTFIVVALGAIVCVGGVILAEIQGWIVTPHSNRTSVGNLADVTVILAVTAVLVSLFSENLRASLAEARQHGAALEETEERYRAIFDRSLDCVYINDFEGRFLDANSAALSLLGYSREEISSLSFASLLSEDQLPKAMRALEEVKTTGTQRGIVEFRLKRKNGEYVDVETKSSLVLHEGKPIAMQGVARDITARKRDVESLQREKAFTEKLLESLPGIFYLYDANLKLRRWNRNHETATGYSREEMAGKDMGSWHLSNEEKAEEISRFILAGETDHGTLESALRHKDGTSVPYLFTGVRMDTADGPMLMGVGMDITQPKHAEEELRWKTAFLEAQVDASPDGILVVNSQRKWILHNQRFTELWQIPKEIFHTNDDEVLLHYVLGQTKFPEQFYEKVMHLYNHINETSQDEIECNNGMIVDRYSSPVLGKDGQFYGRIWTFRDITERKKAEEALRQSEGTLRSVFRMAPVGICVLKDRIYQSANEFWCEKFGYPIDQLLGKTPEALYECKEEYRRVEQELYSHLHERGLTTVETRLRRGDGVFRNVILTAAPIRHDDVSAGTVVIVHDITDLKRTEAEVQRLKNYLASIIDSMPSILIGVDLEMKVIQWNRQAEQATGIASAQAVGQPIEALLPDFSPWIEALRSELEEHHPASREKQLLVKDGERQFYDLMLYPLVANGIEGAVLRIENVTERTRIQEMMVQTEKMMSVGGLAAGMAHEISNPLGIIAQAAQNVERRILGDLTANRKAAEQAGVSLEVLRAYFESREIPLFIQDIRQASARAGKIVANMLQFSRKSESTLKPAAISDVLERSLNLASSEYDLKRGYNFQKIVIVREYEPDMPAIPMVIVEMEQVFLNLIKNAAQAMSSNPPDRLPQLTLRVRREKKYAVVDVEDNGPGMKENVRQRVFEPFFTTKEPGIGTGLGLSVSYTIVTQNHKGLMSVSSTPGRGARFTVRLPVTPEKRE